jgi:hypothetical protein
MFKKFYSALEEQYLAAMGLWKIHIRGKMPLPQ